MAKDLMKWWGASGKPYRTISGAPPLTYKAIEGTLKNYRIYGNTISGESVGDLVETGEHAGEYRVPVTVSNGTDSQTSPIYLPEQIKMVGNEAEYIDYSDQKQHRVRKNLLNEEYIQGNPISNSIIRVKCKTPIPLVKGELYTISFDSGSLFDVSLGSSPTPEYPFAADTTILSSCGNSLNWLTSPYTFECVNDGYISVTIRKKDNTPITPDEVNFAIQFEKNSTATSYEPYIEDIELNVTLPALPTLSGTSILSIGTTVQPSEVYIKGKIKEKDPIVPAMDLSSVGTSLRTGGDPDVIAGNYADEYEGDSGV